MLDYKSITFLTLCEEMNYRKTAAVLNMTQPAVTQHIHALEAEYGCKLFCYNGHTLTKTPQAELLQNHLRRVRYDDAWLRSQMQRTTRQPLHLGATKSIGDFMVTDKICRLIAQNEYEVHLLVDNTQVLLEKLRNGTMDIAMIEGEFDKCSFGWRKMHTEPFVGICSKDSPLANREVTFPEAAACRLLLREEGSGTRDIWETQLKNHGKAVADFASFACISSFTMMKEIIAQNLGITFAYQSVMENDPRLSRFQIQGYESEHDLYYVYLKNTHAKMLLEQLDSNCV